MRCSHFQYRIGVQVEPNQNCCPMIFSKILIDCLVLRIAIWNQASCVKIIHHVFWHIFNTRILFLILIIFLSCKCINVLLYDIIKIYKSHMIQHSGLCRIPPIRKNSRWRYRRMYGALSGQALSNNVWCLSLPVVGFMITVASFKNGSFLAD